MTQGQTTAAPFHKGKILPLTGIFGDADEGTMEINQIVGLSQSSKDPEDTIISYTGDNFYSGPGTVGMNDVMKRVLDVPIKSVFTLMTQAYEKGEVVDLSDDNLIKEGLVAKPAPNPAKPAKGFWAKTFG